MAILRRVRAASQQLMLFAGASLAYGIGTSIFDSTFNNFLNEKKYGGRLCAQSYW